jgi:ABC-type multidrug transport system fused ATPase/permease subunit
VTVGLGARPAQHTPARDPAPAVGEPPRSRRWWGLGPYLSGHRTMLAIATVLGLCASAVGLALPLVARHLVDALSAHRPMAATVALLVLLAVVDAVLSGGGNYLLERTAETVVLGVRRALAAHLARLRVAVLDEREPGDLTARITADSDLLRDMITVSLVGGFTGLLVLAGVVAMMGAVDVVLLGVSAATMAGAGLLIVVMTQRINRSAVQAQEAVGEAGAALERMFGAFRTMKAYGAENVEVARLDRAVTRLWRAGVRAGGWSAVATGMVEMAVQAAFLVVLAVGGARVASGTIGIGSLVAFLMYVFMLVAPVNQLLQAVIRYQVGAAGAARIAEVLALPAESRPAPPEATTSAAPGPASVRFEGVRFRYGPRLRYVHDDVGFDIPPRGMTAFVGASGVGKTTVFSLLERFYDVESGRILVDGRDLREWPVTELRAMIGYVEQEATGLSGTLRQNILYGAADAGEATLRSVLAQVRLDRIVDALPQGLDTPVGHRGTRLSGGERQRLAIARALVRRPRLLLLDEVTSQLDAGNEASLRDAVAEIAKDTTVLVIAHRLSTVAMADRIVVLDAGRVRAIGTHLELIRDDPGYAELAATQLIAPA